MSGITLQWLQSEPMSDVMKYDIKSWWLEISMSQTVRWGAVVLAVISVLCLVMLLICVRKKRKCRTVLEEQPNTADCSITQELPVTAIQTDRRSLNILTDIVYCESEEIIP